MSKLTFTRKDFEIEWFSGTGPGGQHRNKRRNCCRITHKETGIRAQCAAHRDRVSNQREAFYVIAARLLAFYNTGSAPGRRADGIRVRTYNEARNEVIDSCGARSTYKQVVLDADLGGLIEARREAMEILSL